MTDSSIAVQQQRSLALHGVIILFLGLLAGIGFSIAAATQDVTSPIYGAWRFAHMEGLVNGLVVLAVAGVWLRIDVHGKFINIARIILVLGCYANIVGPIINALFIGKRLIAPETGLEAIVVYGFYIPGTLPIISFAIFIFNLLGRKTK